MGSCAQIDGFCFETDCFVKSRSGTDIAGGFPLPSQFQRVYSVYRILRKVVRPPSHLPQLPSQKVVGALGYTVLPSLRLAVGDHSHGAPFLP